MSNNNKTDHGEDGSTTLTGKGSTLARVTQDNDKHKSGAIHEDQGLSTNDREGIKYCPGGELPRYNYVSYKPSCSRKKDWVLNINPGSEDRFTEKDNLHIGGSTSNNIEPEHPDVSNLRTEFSALNIRDLISSWEDREMNVLEID